MKRFFLIFALAFVGAIGYGVYLSFEAQDLGDIEGRAEDDRELNPKSVPITIEMAAKNRQPVTVTEKNLNTWLANTLKVRQEGQLAEHVALKGVWVRFDKDEGGRAEVVIEREVEGRAHTTSMFFRVERKKKEDDSFTTYIRKDGGHLWGVLPVGGKFGKIRVPQGFLFFTQSSFKALAALFEEELDWMEEEIITKGGGRILFEEGQMRITFPDE